MRSPAAALSREGASPALVADIPQIIAVGGESRDQVKPPHSPSAMRASDEAPRRDGDAEREPPENHRDGNAGRNVGDQTGDGDTPAAPKPTEMKVYDKDGVTLLGTLAKTGDGIYSGDITLTSWQNFLFADLENNIWYGSVPDALTSITSDDSKWNLWISDGAAGTHTIEVNLNTMTWSSQLKEQGGGGSTYPTELKVYAATDWNNPGATLTATDQEGVYSGTLTTTMEWEQFKIVDGSTWYGADGNKMSVDGGNMWAGGEIGAYTIVANLKEMTWSATKQ